MSLVDLVDEFLGEATALHKVRLSGMSPTDPLVVTLTVADPAPNEPSRPNEPRQTNQPIRHVPPGWIPFEQILAMRPSRTVHASIETARTGDVPLGGAHGLVARGRW